MKNPFLSILTPTYNREKYITNLAKSIANQKTYNIEWLIGDDGSIDSTESIIRDSALNLNIDVTYIKSSKRIGKACMDNILIQHARGKFIVWCDSDDYFIDNVFKEIFEYLDEIEKNDIELSGAIFQNIDEKLQSQSFYKNKIPPVKKIINFEEMKYYLKGDATIFTKKELIKKIHFQEVDFIISEGTELDRIFKDKFFLISNKIVKIMNRDASDSVSFGKKMRFNRGMTYSMINYLNIDNLKSHSITQKILDLTNLWRYSIHGDLSIKKIFKIWPLIAKKPYLVVFYLSGMILAIHDILLNKVEKTHLEFEKNKKNNKISIIKLSEK